MSTDPVGETVRVDLTGRNEVALEVIQERHQTPVYSGPRLRGVSRIEAPSQNIRKRATVTEAKTRGMIRGLNEEISRYFKVPEGRREWTSQQLLSRGKYHRGRRSDILPYLYFLSDPIRRISRGAIYMRFCFGRPALSVMIRYIVIDFGTVHFSVS